MFCGPHCSIFWQRAAAMSAQAWLAVTLAGFELFEQASERLAPNGMVYLIISSKSDLQLLSDLIRQAGFSAELVNQRFIVLETFLIFQLRVMRGKPHSLARQRNPA